MAPTPNTMKTEFYVSVSGNENNPGSLYKPWATISHAAEVLTAGQTVYIRGGTYRLEKNIIVKNSGTENAWITFTAYPGEKVVIDASGIEFDPIGKSPIPQGVFHIEQVSYIRVIGIEIQDTHIPGFVIRESHHIELPSGHIQDHT